jgi:hypothetical protein
MAKYFHVLGAASGPGAQYMDEQIKILMRESPALIIKHWEVMRQYQAKFKKLLSEFSAPEANKVRQGIASSCTKDNLDCPEILRLFGRPQ